MSALHQNAASLVNTKAEHNGPDQILTAADYTSSVRNIPVILRKEEVGLGAEEPLSVPSLLQQVSVGRVGSVGSVGRVGMLMYYWSASRPAREMKTKPWMLLLSPVTTIMMPPLSSNLLTAPDIRSLPRGHRHQVPEHRDGRVDLLDLPETPDRRSDGQ